MRCCCGEMKRVGWGRFIRRVVIGCAGFGFVGIAGLYGNSLRTRRVFEDVDLQTSIGISYPPALQWKPPGRVQLLDRLSMSREKPYDVLIIGGGATGCGVAVDAASR